MPYVESAICLAGQDTTSPPLHRTYMVHYLRLDSTSTIISIMASGRAVHLHSMPTGEGGTLHRRWLTRTSNQNQTKKCYCPQVGDSVVYVPKAHSYVLEKFGEGDGTISKPWESWPTNTSWPAVRCTVTQAIYRFPYRTCYYPDLGDDRFLDVTAPILWQSLAFLQ